RCGRPCAFYLLRPLVTIELSAGLTHDDRHACRHAPRIPPGAQEPPRLGARKPRVAATIGRPPARRAASTAANLRPPVLGPAVPTVERLGGCRLRRPARNRHPLAADRLQALLDLEEPPRQARPPGCGPGAPSTHPKDVQGQPPSGARRAFTGNC